VGPNGGTADTGWPDVVPGVRPGSLSIAPGVATGDRTIAFNAPIAPGGPCAKCTLKLRGWNEEKLPCAWNHPDLF
jgi:hypothetical protein